MNMNIRPWIAFLSIIAGQLVGASSATALTMTFDDLNGNDPYQHYQGVTITNTRLGNVNQVIAGSDNGDPGNWDINGTNGPYALATNQSTNVMTFAYDSPVSLTTLDVGSNGDLLSGFTEYNFQAVAFLGATEVGTFNVTFTPGTRVADGDGYWDTLTLSGVSFDSFRLSATGAFAWTVDNVQVNIPSDADSDGVDDSVDLCPNTPPGAVVDSNGCADAQKDTDSDGVDDAADLCPNTAPGAVVDSNGCSEAQQNNTASPVPTLPVWMIMLLISMLAGLGVRRGKSNLLVE